MRGEGFEEVELEHVDSKGVTTWTLSEIAHRAGRSGRSAGYTSLNEGLTKADGRGLGEPDPQTGEVYVTHVASTSSADHTGRL